MRNMYIQLSANLLTISFFSYVDYQIILLKPFKEAKFGAIFYVIEEFDTFRIIKEAITNKVH